MRNHGALWFKGTSKNYGNSVSLADIWFSYLDYDYYFERKEIMGIAHGKSVMEKRSFFIVVDENNYDENGVQYCLFVIYNGLNSRNEVDRTLNVHGATKISTLKRAQKIAEYYNENYSKTGAVVIAVQETVKTIYKRI